MVSDDRYGARLSAAIAWLRFPLIFMIVLLHCYSAVRLEGHAAYFRAVYPLALWLGETGVPGFFFISGYLFFHSQKSYVEKLRTRVRTLLMPYLLWNGLLLGGYLIAYAAGFPQDINHRNMADFGMIDYLRLFWDRGSFDDGNFVPLLCPFWYIRNLLIMCVLSPLLYYIIRYTREAFLIAIAAWWLTVYHNAFIPQTLLFFSLGAYFAIHTMNPLQLFCQHKLLVIMLFTVLAAVDILSHTAIRSDYALQFHRLSLIANIPALLLLADVCARKNLSSALLPRAAFIVFAVHYPITVMLRKVCVNKYGDASNLTHIALYLGCVVIVTAASILIYAFMERFTPRLKSLLSGNR